MLDIPDWAPLEKDRLVGGCVRLPLRIDGERLQREIAQLPASLWGTTGGRVGVHRRAEALFLRGYAPAEGDKPVADREVLAQLPYCRQIIEQLVPAPPLRCLLARLPGHVTVPPHIDRAPYFHKTLRLHVAVETHARAWMACAGLCYHMAPGEVWVLNNSTLHGVWNAAEHVRTHLICDFLPVPALLALLARGERNLGVERPEVFRHLALPVPAGAQYAG